MLKFFEIEARFPEFIEEFPQPAVEYVPGLVKVPAAELAKYDLAGAKRHRKQIREALGFGPVRADRTRVRRHHGRPAQGLRPRHRRRPSRLTSCASVRQPVQLVRQGFGDGTDAAV